MRLGRMLLVLICCLSWNIAEVNADPLSVADVAADFSSTSNPTGVWSYGWSMTLGSPFILSSNPAVREGLDTWRGNVAPDGNPAAYHNGTGAAILLGGSAHYAPGQFGLHPGPNGEYALVRYLAPATGEVSLRSTFAGQDLAGTTTDVHVLLNGSSVFDDFVEGVPGASAATFNHGFSLTRGDIIDFAVGFGRNGNYFNDSTALAATIQPGSPSSPTPEPGTLLLFTIGAPALYRRWCGGARRT